MSQLRIQDYGSPVVAQSLKSLIGSITVPGILSGNNFLKDSNTRMRVNPGSCVTGQGVIITEDEIKYLSIDNTSTAVDYTVYYSHTDVNISGGEAATLTLQVGLLTQEVISGCILGYVRYPGGGIPLDQSHFIQPPTLKLGTVIPTTENANWIFPIKNNGYLITYTSGATINITDTWTTYSPVGTPVISLTGSFTNGSTIITNVISTGLSTGMVVQGNIYIPSNTFIASVDSTTQITLTNAVTVTASSQSFTASTGQNIMYVKLRNNGIVTGIVTLTFPFKVGPLPYSLLQIILSTDINALVTPIFIDSIGDVVTLGSGYTGQSDFLLKTETIPQTMLQTPNTIVYLQLMVSLAIGKEARIQTLGLNSYNLPV